MEKFEKFIAIRDWYCDLWRALQMYNIDLDNLTKGYFPDLLRDLFESYFPELSYESFENFRWETYDEEDICRCYEYCKGE